MRRRSAVSQAIFTFGADLFGNMTTFSVNPRTIADRVLALVAMPDGSRPLRYPLDAIVEGTDVDFINARAAIKSTRLEKYTV